MQKTARCQAQPEWDYLSKASVSLCFADYEDRFRRERTAPVSTQFATRYGLSATCRGAAPDRCVTAAVLRELNVTMLEGPRRDKGVGAISVIDNRN
jgi:hypothetical protein